MKYCFLTLLFIFYSLFSSAQGRFSGGNGDGFATVTTSNIVLPVVIKNFEGWVQGNGAVKLAFSVSGDESVCEIIIERSNGNAFAAIGSIIDLFLPGFDKEFSRYDLSPAEGNNYYRLHIRKCNGASVYSIIVLVNLPKKENIYYSYTDQKLYYHLQQGEILQVFNSAGQLILKKTLFAGTRSIAIDLPSTGIFFYSLSGGASGKLLKL
jgi:hypothetical protein